MNRPKKIIFATLGIAASVGIASVLCLGMGSQIPSCCRQEPEELQEGPLISWHLRHIDTDATPSPISICPTPAPKKPLQEGYERVQCDKCGQEYHVYDSCIMGLQTQGQIKHLHLSLKKEARMKKQVAETVHRLIELEIHSSNSLATKAHLVKKLQGFLDE